MSPAQAASLADPGALTLQALTPMQLQQVQSLFLSKLHELPAFADNARLFSVADTVGTVAAEPVMPAVSPQTDEDIVIITDAGTQPDVSPDDEPLHALERARVQALALDPPVWPAPESSADGGTSTDGSTETFIHYFGFAVPRQLVNDRRWCERWRLNRTSYLARRSADAAGAGAGAGAGSMRATTVETLAIATSSSFARPTTDTAVPADAPLEAPAPDGLKAAENEVVEASALTVKRPRSVILPPISADGNEEHCCVCGEGGDIVCCDTCTASYHPICEQELR
jgi:hypothetical protein